MRERIRYVDIAKGIGIFLVVWAHSGGPFSKYINAFHMPLFFIISGFLHNEDSSIKDFVIRKVKTLYVPFVTCNLFTTWLRFGFGLKTAKETLEKTVKILLTVGKDGRWWGATWFLASLFLVAVFYKILDSKLPLRKYQFLVLGGGV